MTKTFTAFPSKCGGVTNTLAISRDEQRIAFEVDSDSDGQTTECNALWIGDLRTGTLRRVPTTGLRPLTPFWLDGNTILFSGIDIDGGNWLPVGIYSVSLSTGNVTRLLDGPYLAPFVADSGKTLYFSWGQGLQSKTPVGDTRPTFKDFSGFHIWKVPLRDVLQQSGGKEHSGASETVNPKDGSLSVQVPVVASAKPKP
jgi:Tol biopolymer transport system component